MNAPLAVVAILLAVGAWLAWLEWPPRASPRVPSGAARAGPPPAAAPAAAALSTDRLRRAVADFDAAYADTFTDDDTDGHAMVRRMFAHRARAHTAFGDARMRLPNDLDAEVRALDEFDAIDRRMLDAIEDARQRLGAPLLHPGPTDDAWYGRWYRASNDVVE